MLYRNTFEKIAAAVALIPDPGYRQNMAARMTTILRDHNPNFNPERFLAACKEEPKRAITIHVMLEPVGRSLERASASEALRDVAETIDLRGINGASGSIIYDDDNNEIGHVTTETKDV